MRNLMRAMILGALVVSLIGCGKEEGDKRSSSSSSSVIGTGTGTVYTSFSTLKKAFTSSGFNKGVTSNTTVYHVGPMYGGAFSNSSFSSGGSFCFFGENLFGNDDKCDSGYYSTQQLNDIIDKGEYKVIRSATSTTVSYGVARFVENGTFSYDEETFDANNENYRKMLNLDNKEYYKILVSAATVSMSNAGSIKGNFVEYFYKDGTYEAYIVSSALSKIANPVASYKGTFSLSGSLSFSLDGRLYNTSQSILTGVSAQYHRVVNDFATGQPTTQPAGVIR